MSCDKDEDQIPQTVTFEYASYDLGVAAPLVIKAKLSVASAEALEVPFTLSGTTSKDVEYTISAEKFVFGAGEREATITIIYKENFEEEADVKLKLTPNQPYEVGQFSEATIGVGVGDKLVYSFNKATEQLADKIQIEINITDIDGHKLNTAEEVHIPFKIKDGSTADYGTNFVVEGAEDGVKEFVLQPGKRTATITLKVLKYDATKTDFTIVVDAADKRFASGEIAESQIEITPTVSTMMAGKWVGVSFDTESYLKDMCSWGSYKHDADALPKNISASDKINVDLSGDKVSLDFELTGDLKNYFRDCTIDFVETVDDQEFYGTQPSPMEPPLRFNVAKYTLSKANVYFDAAEVKETTASVGFYIREVNGKEQLDVIIYDYAPKSFLADSYKNAIQGQEYMPEYYQLRYTFVRE